MLEIIRTICLAGIIQGVLLFFVIILKKNNRQANRFLALYIIFLELDGVELYFASSGHIITASPYQLSIVPYSFIFGPSMYFYCVLLTAQVDTFSKKYLLLYMPFVIALVINIILFLSFKTTDLPRAVIYANMIINGGGLIFEIILYVLSLLMIQKYIGRLKEYFSAIDALKLSLFRAALVILILVVIFIFISLNLGGHVRHEYKIPDVIAIITTLVLIFAIAFFTMIRPEIFNRIQLVENAVPLEDTSCPKYEKLRLPAQKEEYYVNKLQVYMEEKKPYLSEDLTLRNLADELSLSTYHLSMILNIHFKQNFYNFINGYRIEDVKQKLADPDYTEHNILTIAYSAGFNSKSTFNSMFKKFTGKTPKEYRAEISL